jgi:phosphohistidine phosphatase
MNLLIVRHAIAMDAADYARDHADDAGRPLTPEGRKKMKRGARALQGLVPELGLLATSPLTRAAQTAEILAAAYDGLEPTPLGLLAPGQPVAALAEWLERQRHHETIGAVGHEPSLSRAMSWLLGGSGRSFIELKKGAACLLRFDGTVKSGSGTLVWALTPSQLRALGD